MWFSQQDFPNLHAGNHRVTRRASSKGHKYNCIAWAAGFDNRMWSPAKKHHWPKPAPRGLAGCKTEALIIVFESVGYELCTDDEYGSLEDGIEKIAIYADGPEWMHAARQLENGKRTSKMGTGQRIEHDTPADLEGPAYGKVAKYMKRERMAATEP
jgi:hypothetical protein